MYTSGRCLATNITNQPTPQRIADRNARIARAEAKFLNGNQTMADLIAALTPGLPVGTCADLGSSLAMYAISGFPNSVVVVPRNGQQEIVKPGDKLPFAKSGWFPPGSFVSQRFQTAVKPTWGGLLSDEARKLIPGCPCSSLKFCECGPSRPTSTPAMALGPVASLPAKTFDQMKCRSGNICQDLRSGCVSASQVSKAQLFACAKAGWSGNWGLFPEVGVQATLPWLGDVDLNPPPVHDTYKEDVARSQGLGIFDSGFDISRWGLTEWLIAGAGIALAVATLKNTRGLQRKRTFRRYKKRLGA